MDFISNYRPVIICFVQYQHLSVQLVQKKMDRHTKLRSRFLIFSLIDIHSEVAQH